MRISMPNYIRLNLKQVLKNGGFLIGMVIAILPSVAISYSILKLKGPFTIYHVSSFFSIFGIIVPVIIATSVFSKDFHYGTISMVFNSKKNRVYYFFSNTIFAILLGLLFGIVGSITLNVASHMGVPGQIDVTFYAKFILNFILCIVFYMLCAYLLLLMFEKGSIAYISLLIAIEILPNLLYYLESASHNSFFKAVIENMPFYSLSTYLPSGNINLSQYVTLLISILVLSVISITLSTKKDI